MIRYAVLVSLPLLAACTTPAATTGGSGIPIAEAGQCDAAVVQALVGETATATLGGQALRETGAGRLRWIPPRTAVTKDYRQDRLNIEYDDAMMVERIYCG